MASRQGTTPPVLNWLGLPLEIIDNIYRHLVDICDIGNLRLTCTRFGKESLRKTTQAYLYQEIPLTFVQPRVEAFLRATTSHIQDSDLNDQPSATWVRKIVIENAMPANAYDLGLGQMIAARHAYDWHLVEQRRFVRSLKDSYPDLFRSVGLLNNLDTIEYVSGFRTMGASPSTGDAIRLLESADAITRTYENRSDQAQQLTAKLWKHKEQYWGTETLCERNHTGMLIKAALENKSRKGPLRLIIRSVDDSTLFWWYKRWPEDNRLQSLEIAYLGHNKSHAEDTSADLYSLSTAGQFSNLRNMSWAGVSIHHKGSLNLKYLGHELFMPTWTFLSTLELHNIMLASRSVRYLKELNVQARFRNVVWLENSITGFEKGSSLRQVICLGIQVVDYALVTYTIFPLAVDLFPDNCKYGGDIPSKVFLVAYDLEDAQKLAASNAAYCLPTALQDGETVPFVPPENMSRYMIDGGYCPIDGVEDGGAVWAENWQM